MTKAQRERLERRQSGPTNGRRNVWIQDHDGEWESYALEIDGDVCHLVNEDAVEYVVSARGCSCPAYGYSKAGKKICKHSRTVRAFDLLPTLPAVV